MPRTADMQSFNFRTARVAQIEVESDRDKENDEPDEIFPHPYKAAHPNDKSLSCYLKLGVCLLHETIERQDDTSTVLRHRSPSGFDLVAEYNGKLQSGFEVLSSINEQRDTHDVEVQGGGHF